ncbi:capsule polysaccharide biosynthesis protein [Stachybotrys elegans]|uniref:Capsule polysaccharide biosynthesis protein n=1 Tax=Stachybotrys elegans TaxID=80388 RepID=A0A8K0SFK1_9HYPO|nr:capsule polysaccharide biosynthesis protein [Stachybotrys elegans]
MSVRLVLLGMLPPLAYALYKLDVAAQLVEFCTGPGSYSRIFAVLVLAWNWKSLPFVWTFRVFYSMILHLGVRPFHTHTPDKLFHPVISQSHASLNELDYRLHKSNSTYLADIDIARSHLASHLLARAGHLAYQNAKTRFVMDPSDPSRPARGGFNIGVGGVFCSWRREIKPFQQYEMWTRILTWDRKWLYIMTHFVQKGAIKPSSWDAPENFGPTRTKSGKPEGWEKKVFATAVSLYIFKIGRLTVPPATMLQGSGLLPERPGGWLKDADIDQDAPEVNGSAEPVSEADFEKGSWQWVEARRKKGLEYARHLNNMNVDLHGEFDCGDDGALGRFSIG